MRSPTPKPPTTRTRTRASSSARSPRRPRFFKNIEPKLERKAERKADDDLDDARQPRGRRRRRCIVEWFGGRWTQFHEARPATGRRMRAFHEGGAVVDPEARLDESRASRSPGTGVAGSAWWEWAPRSRRRLPAGRTSAESRRARPPGGPPADRLPGRGRRADDVEIACCDPAAIRTIVSRFVSLGRSWASGTSPRSWRDNADTAQAHGGDRARRWRRSRRSFRRLTSARRFRGSRRCSPGHGRDGGWRPTGRAEEAG